jgi:hypothetical protein
MSASTQPLFMGGMRAWCRRECWLELARVISGKLKVPDQAARSIC